MIQAVIKGAYNLLVGMGVTFKNMLSKPVTFQYPEQKRVMPERYRGRHFLNPGTRRVWRSALGAVCVPSIAR